METSPPLDEAGAAVQTMKLEDMTESDEVYERIEELEEEKRWQKRSSVLMCNWQTFEKDRGSK